MLGNTFVLFFPKKPRHIASWSEAPLFRTRPSCLHISSTRYPWNIWKSKRLRNVRVIQWRLNGFPECCCILVDLLSIGPFLSADKRITWESGWLTSKCNADWSDIWGLAEEDLVFFRVRRSVEGQERGVTVPDSSCTENCATYRGLKRLNEFSELRWLKHSTFNSVCLTVYGPWPAPGYPQAVCVQRLHKLTGSVVHPPVPGRSGTIKSEEAGPDPVKK